MAARYELDQNSFIHVQRTMDNIEGDMSLMNEAELIRHNRYSDNKKRKEFLAGRTLIKTEMSTLLGIKPTEVVISLSENGKPYCQQEGENPVHFNLSHGSGHFVIAFSLHPIGVDLEKKREVSFEEMQPILSKLESQQLAELSDKDRSRAILSLFTTKEAFIKSTDKKYGLDEIGFSLSEGYWKLKSPEVKCTFQHIEHKELIIAVSVYLG
ncbi:MAG: 4'-phosphopantetheinyl transferase superfamily protein [Flavobacteriales bacterium]|nr:4'-phosphopantetheinyl transferase superfamily protein [Flavobacteriales bacterium]